MRRTTILLALVVVVAGAGTFLVIDRNRLDPWLDCTMPQRNPAPTPVTVGEPIGSVVFDLVVPMEGAIAIDLHPDTGAMYVATKGGTVEHIDDAGATTVIDLSAEVSTTLEQGLLGLAVAPDGSHLYLDFTDLDDDTHVVEYELDGNGLPMLDSRRQVLFVEQPFPTHNGGHLLFGPDGYLWIGLGDGGGSVDGPDFGWGPNAQDLTSLHGSLLRIDPRPSGSAPYGIPGDNPFVGVEGARDEIWMIGLRNPWRFGFDSATGDLWVGDVGQFCWEEINHLPATEGRGAAVNLGWPIVEGPDEYRGGSVEGLTWAAYDLPRSEGFRSVVGGVVYRGAAIPDLVGWYLFADTYIGAVRAMRVSPDGSVQVRPIESQAKWIASFTEGLDGEVYAVSLQEGIYRMVRSQGIG